MMTNVAVAALMICVTAALGQEGHAEERPLLAASPNSAASVHSYGDVEKTCGRWNDGCTICTKGADKSLHCSNIGIACQPKEIQCTGRIITDAHASVYLVIVLAALAAASFWGGALLWVTGYFAALW